MSAAKTQQRGLRRQLVVVGLLDVVAPLAAFYLLAGAGVAPVWSYVLAGVVPALRAVVTAVVTRRVETASIVSVSLFLLGALMAALTGDARLIFAKDGWLTGAFGLWMIASLLMARPFMLVLGRTIAVIKVGDAGGAEWESRWSREPRFRHDLRLVSVVIGAVLVLDAVVRVIIAYVAPVTAVPTISTVQYVVMLAGLLLWFFSYTKRHGLRA